MSTKKQKTNKKSEGRPEIQQHDEDTESSKTGFRSTSRAHGKIGAHSQRRGFSPKPACAHCIRPEQGGFE